MDLYGIIGKQLVHSFSPEYFNKKFKKEGIDAQYRVFEIGSAELLNRLIKSEQQLCGLNVTIPYKESVMPLLSFISSEAKEIGAVNTIKIIREKEGPRLLGFNTDAAGFRKALAEFTGETGIQKALILGTGGSAKAVGFALGQLGIQYTIVSRHPVAGQLYYEEIDAELMQECRLVVNTTPLGMYPEITGCPDLPFHLLTTGHFVFDLVYNPAETLMLKKAKRQGAKTENGLKMLYYQAEASWEAWQKNNQSPSC